MNQRTIKIASMALLGAILVAMLPQPDQSVDAEAGLTYDRSGGPNNGRVFSFIPKKR